MWHAQASGNCNFWECIDVISPLEYPDNYVDGEMLEPFVILVHHTSWSFEENQFIGQLAKKWIV